MLRALKREMRYQAQKAHVTRESKSFIPEYFKSARSMQKTVEEVGDMKTEMAEEVKERANEFFKGKNYEQAVLLYTEAIELHPVASYYGNRSFANLKLENYGYALEDANKSLELDRKYIKGYYRRASAYMALGKFKPALKDYETVVKVKPNDADAKVKCTECSKIVKRQAFEKAIACDEVKKIISESIHLDAMTIDDSYKGPRITENRIDREFMSSLIEFYKSGKDNRLSKRDAYFIILEVKKVLQELPSLVDITIEENNQLTVCGDIHGQYYDLCHIFEINGLPSEENPYLFNGDFVDRGSWSVEVILVLFGFKVLYPKHFHLVRGNHETDSMNQMYGFEGEVKAKYTGQMMDLFSEVFNFLPLAYCINNKVMVMHGGLCQENDLTLDDLRKIDRNRQPPEDGPMCDLLWSDPQFMPGHGTSKRGVSFQFGPDVTEQFLERNNLDYIIRSHEVKNDGYEVTHKGKCITIFSAPNYCDQMGNKGAFIHLKAPDLTPEFTQFEAVPHPEAKPMQYANSMMRLAGLA